MIIIEQAEKAICDELLRNFDDGIVVFNKNNTKYEQKIQIARGIAFYEPDCIDSLHPYSVKQIMQCMRIRLCRNQCRLRRLLRDSLRY